MSTSKKSDFLLLFRHLKDGPDLSPEEMQQTFGRWRDWLKGMKEKGQLTIVAKLQEGGQVRSGATGSSVTDGPFAESKEIVGGLAVVQADSLAQASEIARGCPGFAMGSVVEIRPIEDLPAL
jgi:hypothetical protein